MLPVAVANHEQAQGRTETEKQKSVFLIGMVRIKNPQGLTVLKHRLGFFKRYTVFVLVDSGFLLVPRRISCGCPFVRILYVQSKMLKSLPDVFATQKLYI